MVTKADQNLVMRTDASGSLWISGITNGGTPTYTASGLKLKFGFEQPTPLGS